ncbi:MAG: hypothetical protein ACRD27_02255 [Terracidiphilus sp.]
MERLLMKHRLYAHVGFAAGAFLLIGTLALSQSKPAAKKPQHHAAAGSEAAGTQNHTGHAKSLAVNEQGSTKCPCTYWKHKKTTMDRGNSGGNASHKPTKKTASKSAAGASTTGKYKDPEDMTTRHRSGNNKTAVKNPGTPHSSKGASPQ